MDKNINNINNIKQESAEASRREADDKSKGIFACGDQQVSSAGLILDSQVRGIATILTGMINNMSSASSSFIASLGGIQTLDQVSGSGGGGGAPGFGREVDGGVIKNNGIHNLSLYKKAYYQDRLCTFFVFIMIILVYKNISRLSFYNLKKAVNESACSIEEFIKLKRQTDHVVNFRNVSG
tara:strand:- start:2372 stop:2914 length:543 start_codon:yes stop_codon:yes gene_type:complete